MSVEAVASAWASTLSQRELQVALSAARGLSNKDVARELGLTEPTVKQHMHRIFRKLGAPNRYHLILSMNGAGSPASAR
jgi:DNA-binding NarL/FixJ family response regulator